MFIRRIIEEYPEVYEDEIQGWLLYARGKAVSVASINRCIKNMGLTRRKVTNCFFSFIFSWSLGIFDGRFLIGFCNCVPILLQLNVIARERNQMNRAIYRRQIAAFRREQLIFIDESAKDERTFTVRVFFEVRF